MCTSACWKAAWTRSQERGRSSASSSAPRSPNGRKWRRTSARAWSREWVVPAKAGTHVPLGRDHSAVAQQGFDIRLAAAEGLERFRRRPAAADAEDLVAESGADLRIQDAVLFEEAVGVGRKHFGPLIAVVPGRVSASEDMREAIREAVVGRRLEHRDLGA